MRRQLIKDIGAHVEQRSNMNDIISMLGSKKKRQANIKDKKHRTAQLQRVSDYTNSKPLRKFSRYQRKNTINKSLELPPGRWM